AREGARARPAAELTLAGGEAARLAQVGHWADVHLQLARAAALRVPRGELRGPLQHRPREDVEPVRVADDHVAAGMTGDVQPPVPRIGHTERQLVVLDVALADEDLESLDLEPPEAAALARHGVRDPVRALRQPGPPPCRGAAGSVPVRSPGLSAPAPPAWYRPPPAAGCPQRAAAWRGRTGCRPAGGRRAASRRRRAGRTPVPGRPGARVPSRAGGAPRRGRRRDGPHAGTRSRPDRSCPRPPAPCRAGDVPRRHRDEPRGSVAGSWPPARAA